MSSHLYRRFLANLIIALLTIVWSGTPSLADGQVLKIFTWSEYMAPEIVKAFEEKTGAKIEFQYFETDRDRDRILLHTDGGDFDLVLVDEITIAVFKKSGWLSPITAETVPNLKNIDERFFDVFDYTAGYAVPYFWGLTGIAYRSDLVDGDIETWRELLEGGPRFKAPMAMVDNGQEMIGIAMKALGHSVNEKDPDLINSAAALLERQKKQVSDYSYISVDENSGLATGKISAAYVYSADYLTVAEYTDKLKFVFPKEGGLLWIDYFVTLERSTNKALAAAFLDFLNDPEVAAVNAEYTYYTTPNLAAIAHTSTEYRENEIIFPSDEILARYEFPERLPPRTLRRYNSIMSSLLR